MKAHAQSLLPVLSALIVSTGTVWAQADFAEDFESLAGAPFGAEPQVLIDRGWDFRNQSQPADGAAWVPGDNFGGAPFDGSGYLTTSGLVTDFFGGQVSTWAILPDIDGLRAGDLFTVWVSGGGSASSPTHFDVRYAPSGDATGSGADDVGDFTQLLYSAELPIAQSGYQRVQVEVPGDGRLAMRFHAPFLRTFAGSGAIISIDTLSVGPAGNDPCGIPIPEVGETVIWSAAAGPYMLCQDITIPAGGRVEVEPGTTIDFSGGTLTLEGELAAVGTGAQQIVLSGQNGFDPGLSILDGGQAEIRHARVATRIATNGVESGLILTDSTVTGDGSLTGVRPFVLVDNCFFDGGAINSLVGMVRITNTAFVGGGFASMGGFVQLDHISIDGSLLDLRGISVDHPVLLDNIEVVNNTSGPGIRLYGPNYLIGPNVTLANNLYPLEMTLNAGGLLPGSTLPASGNINNYIPVESMGFGFDRHWADTGIPYVVDDFPANYGGTLIVEPGTNIKFRPGAGAFIVGSAELVLQGTREEPILLESFTPGNRWFGLKWVDDFDAKTRHTIFDGGEISVQSDGGVMDMVHSTVRNSLTGTASVTGGIVRLFGTEIIDNTIGMTTTTSGRIEADGFVAPSVFEGNAVAVDYNNTSGLPFMRNNWWGDPSGPTSPLHPSGEGDVVQDLHPAAFTPFLTAPPLLDDQYPTVDMEPLYFTARAGDKVILRWTSRDDHEIVEHRIEFADSDFPSRYQTIATLPGDATTYELTIPSFSPTNLYTTPSGIRVVAIDSVGQQDSDKSLVRVPYQEDWTVVPQTVQTPSAVVRPSENIDFCWSPGGNASAYVLLDGIAKSDSAGGSNGNCLPIGATMPYSSTDTARLLIITTFGAGGRLAYWFSDYFSIRPDDRIGDEPPAVTVTSPAAGDTYFGTGVVPVRWDASDDEGLRSFRIQASYDGGRTWHSVVRDLPGDARSYDWRLPESAGIDDVRVRVVAVDHRFQDSSGTTGAFGIRASNPCPADITGDGVLDFFDISAFINAFNTNNPAADMNADGMFDFFDISDFLSAFGAGCP